MLYEKTFARYPQAISDRSSVRFPRNARVCYAECDKISRRLINKLRHTIYYQVAYNQYQFVCLLNHVAGVMPAMLVTRVDISANESMSIKDLDRYINHSQSQHQSRTITSNMFRILKKCSRKFDCLLYEMFLVREHKPCLNIQSDSIKAKLFT